MRWVAAAVLLLLLLLTASCYIWRERSDNSEIPAVDGKVENLPEPARDGLVSVEEALNKRVSRREFRDRALETDEVSQIVWAAGGLGVDGSTEATRTAPSAGATHPLEIYLVAGRVDGLAKGIYRYLHQEHSLQMVREGDYRGALSEAALGQFMVARAPASVVVVAHYERTTGRYGERGKRYVHMEAGHAAQNISLQVEALGLGTVVIGAFGDDEVSEILQQEGVPLVIMPVGRAR